MDHSPEHTAEQMRQREAERRRKEGLPTEDLEDVEPPEPSPNSLAGQQSQTLKDAAEGKEPA